MSFSTGAEELRRPQQRVREPAEGRAEGGGHPGEGAEAARDQGRPRQRHVQDLPQEDRAHLLQVRPEGRAAEERE